jgi:hypothetical protein
MDEEGTAELESATWGNRVVAEAGQVLARLLGA